MCEPYPGPRCSYDAGRKVVARRNKLETLTKKHGADDARVLLADARLGQAIIEYHATPDGIASLEEEARTSPSSKRLLEEARTTRRLQQQALAETRNGRPHAYATLITHFHPFHSEEEALSMMDAAREKTEEEALRSTNPWDWTEPATVEQQARLRSLLQASITQLPSENTTRAHELLETLAKEQPLSVALTTSYQRALEHGPGLMKKNMRREIATLAHITGMRPTRLAAYYEAYRQQYLDDYAHLPGKERPDPPAHWVAGEFSQAGQTRHPLSRWLPRDSASTYALARLRHDPDAVPDHERTTPSYVACTIEPETEHRSKIHLRPYTPTGRASSPTITLTSDQGRLRPQESATAHELMQGRILLSSTNKEQLGLLKQHHLPVNRLVLPDEFAARQDEVPDYSMETLLQYRNLQPGHDGTANLFFQLRREGTSQWAQKPARKTAAVVEEVPSSTKWDHLWAE